MKNSPMLDAFLKQNKINDKEADERDALEVKRSQQLISDATKTISRSQKITNCINIPTKNVDITVKEIESHHQFKNYDHSLEERRGKGLKRSAGGLGIIMEPVD